jgi:ribosomal protein L17
MADEEQPQQQQPAVADTPAEPTPEPSRSATLKKGKADLEALKKETSPVEKAPDSATPAAETAPKPEAEKEGSRREQGQKLREQVRRELLAEFEADNKARQTRQQAEQQQREWDDLLARADQGDFEAKDRVMEILKGNRGMQAAIAQGRTAVLEELGRDITKAVYGLDGVDEEGQSALLKAPSIADFGKEAFDQGRRIERSVHEGTIATLKAENESLKGQLASRSPSPTATNGTSVTRNGNGRFHSMQDAFAAAAAELNYRPQG